MDKKGISTKWIVIIAVICGCLISLISYAEIKFYFSLKPKTYELTDEEKAYLMQLHPSSASRANIEQGILYSYEYSNLEKLRFAYASLEEKYPGYRFSISAVTMWGTFMEYHAKEEDVGEYFSIYLHVHDGAYEARDNFYGYLIRDEYAAYLKEQLEEKGVEGIARVKVSVSSVEGREYDSSMTVEDIVSGRLEVDPTVSIYLTAVGMQEEECIECYETITKALDEMSLPDTLYYINFYDMTEEEILAAKERSDFVYIYSNHYSGKRKDEEE